ncbi:MAG TPA: hypothetical protein VEV17_01380, partial [Bryobacteraceae bacterium]|nr:hypothetical protein [Bryobacteraceae bacterium]
VAQAALDNAHQQEDHKVMAMSIQFLRDDRGQDLIEYTLLLAFVALASASLFIGAGGSVNQIWSIANSHLTMAESAANS